MEPNEVENPNVYNNDPYMVSGSISPKEIDSNPIRKDRLGGFITIPEAPQKSYKGLALWFLFALLMLIGLGMLWAASNGQLGFFMVLAFMSLPGYFALLAKIFEK